MTLNKLGEFGIIDKIRRATRTDASVLKGIGDDTAVLRGDAKNVILFTTDMLIEGRHFLLNKASAYEIGWKSMAVNVSDIAAMGGLPTHAVAAVGLPGKLSAHFIDELYKGMRAVAARFKINLVGGDTNRADKLILSVAMLGKAKKAVLRSGAKANDVIFVSGALGGSYRSKRHLRFVPRVKESQFLVNKFKINAMMDISDGLASDIHRLTEESKVGALIYKEQIPVNRGATFKQALGEGEDFELLFTTSPGEAVKIARHKNFHVVGQIVNKKKGVRIADVSGKSRPLSAKGFDHFRT